MNDASPPAAETPVAARAVVVEARPAPARAAWWLVALLGLATILTAVFAWRAEQRVRGVEHELVRRQQDAEGATREAGALARQAQEGMRDAAAKLSLLEARFNEVTVQRTQLEELIQSLARSRDENVVIDIDAAIRVALQQTALTGSAEPLVAALKQSDDRLARVNQPRLEPARRAIARDLDRVRTVALADVPSLVIKLDEAVRMIDELPLLSAAGLRRDPATGEPVQAAARPPAPAASAPGEPGFVRRELAAAWRFLTERVWNDVRSLVRVTRIDRPDAVLMSPDQGFFLRENLKLRLLNARLALLSRQFDTAQGDLDVCLKALDRYFDRGARRTQLAGELLRQVAAQARQVHVPRPDETLAALAALATAGR